jgi:oxygen-independent coproporphyrinogen-3 oxidase
MECSPAYLEFEDIDELRDMGFNRISMGIQDLRADVLASINRDAPKHPVKKLVDYMKAKGFEGVNLDLVYGLPRQTVDSFLDTVAKIVEIRPDRLVTFSYAHVPWVKKGQVVLEKYGLPTPEEKMQMLVQSMEYLNAQGYQTIGMDHYALPTDSLAQALATKKLHRNFQGYCTRETTGQVYGFGASSISQLQGAYSQNLKVTRDYMNAIEAGNFPTERGYSLSVIEQIRRDVINEIMCNAFLDFDEIATKYDKPTDEIKEIVAYEAHKLDSFVADSLVNISGNQITISEAGRLIVRNIAMVFDPALQTGAGVYSKTV